MTWISNLRLRADSVDTFRYYQIFGIGSRAVIAYPLRHDKSIQDILFQNLFVDYLLGGGFDGYRLHHADA